MFCLNIITKNEGIKKELSYFYEKPFKRGISVLTEPGIISAWITESRWCKSKCMMVEKTYYIFDKSIYEKSDLLSPVFSIDPKFESYMNARNEFLRSCEYMNKLFDEIQIPRLIDIEYFYGYTTEEIHNLKPKIIADVTFYKAVTKNAEQIKGLSETLKLFKIPMPNLREIVKDDPETFMPIITEVITKELKTWIVSQVYGGDFSSFTSYRL